MTRNWSSIEYEAGRGAGVALRIFLARASWLAAKNGGRSAHSS